ncbi:MAG: hypothetical protein ACODAJ_08855 [Planctomycetota bacterium]
MDEQPTYSYGTSAVLAAASGVVGLANWALYLLAERGATFGLGHLEPSVPSFLQFLVGLVLLCVGTSLAAMAMVPRGAWPLGAGALLVHLALAVQMALGPAAWQTALACSVLAGLATLVMLVIYRRRRAAGQRDKRTRRVIRWAWAVLAVALIIGVVALIRGLRG